MKTPYTPKRFHLSRTQLLRLITPVAAFVPFGHSADVFKANNADGLETTTSWVGGLAPTATDVAVFDASVVGIVPDTVTGFSYMPFSQAASWQGIRVANAPGVNLAVDSFNLGLPALTIGAAGIDLTAAASGTTFQLYGQALTIGASQTWSVADGATLELTNGSTIARATGAILNVKLGLTGTGVIKPDEMFGAPGAVLPWATIDGADFVAVNADQTALVKGSTLGTYVANPTAVPPSVSGTFNSVIDVINSGTGAGSTALRFSNNITLPGIRFNTAHATGLDWTVDGTGTTRNISLGNGGILVGPNVGAHNVVFNGASWFRIGNGDLFIHQFNTAGDLIFNNAMSQASGSARLTKNGPGRLILTNNGNNFSGQTTILEGTLQVGNGGASGIVSSNTGSGIANFGVLATNRTDNWTLVNSISGTGSLQKFGGGTMTLSGTNTYTGQTDINAGFIAFGSAANLGAASNPINIAGGGLQWAGVNTTDISTHPITFGTGGATFDVGANNVTIAGSIGNSGVGGLTKTGTGNLTLSASNIYSGDTALVTGELTVTNTAGSATGTGNVTVANNTVLSGTGTISGNVTVATGGKIKPGVDGVGTLTLGGLNLGVDSLMDLDFSSVSSYDKVVLTNSDGLSLNGGMLRLNPTGTTGSVSTVGTYDIIQYAGNVGGAGLSALSVVNPQPGYAYLFSTSGGFVKLDIAFNGVLPEWTAAGSGSWASAGNWSDPTAAGVGGNYTAEFKANLGSVATVTLDGDRMTKGLSFSGSGGYVIAPGTGGTLTIDNGVSAAGITVSAGNHEISVPLALNSTAGVSVATGLNLLISGNVSGAGGITKSGDGTLDLTGNNGSLSGNVNVVGGVLGFATANSLGSGSLILNGGTLRYDTGNTADISTKTITLGINGGTIDTNGNDVTFASPITNSGIGSFTKKGEGSLTLDAVNTYTGETFVTGGSLFFSTNENLGDQATAAKLTLNGGMLVPTATLSLSNAAASPRPVAVGANGAEVYVGDGIGFTVPGVLTGTGALTKSGAGELLLTGVNSGFSGAVTLAAGTVRFGSATANGQTGLGSGAITLGDGVSLYLNGAGTVDGGTSFGALANALVIPGGVSASLYAPQRGGYSGVASGAGTLNLHVDGTRCDINGVWPAFTGVLNVRATGAGTDDYRTVADHNMSGATVNIGAGVQVLQGTTPPNNATGSIHQFGALNADSAAVLGGNSVSGRYNVYQIGALNTDSVIDGRFTGSLLGVFGYGYPRVIKVGTGTLTINGSGHMISTPAGVNTLTVNAGTLKLMGSIERFYTGAGVDGVFGRDTVSLLCDDTISTTPPTTLFQETHPGAALVAEGATLAGNGRFGGATTINGILRPDATGTLGGRLAFTNTATLLLSGTSTTQFDFGGTTFTGISCDAAAGVTYGGTLKLNFLDTVYSSNYTLFQMNGGASGGTFTGVTVMTKDATDVSLAETTPGSGVWTGTVGAATVTFSQSTGVLEVTGGATATLPAVVTGLSATPGNAQVTLNWSNSANAESYVVKRSLASGGLYSIVSTNAVRPFVDTGLTNDTTYYYVVEARNASGLSGLSSEVSATPTAPAVTLNGLDTWRVAQFGAGATNTGNAADNADPDGDGKVNFLEYATNGNPNVADGPALTVGRSTDNLRLAVTYTSVADPLLVYTVQSANGLAGTPVWSQVASTTGGNNVAGPVTVEDTALISANPTRFLRLSVGYTVPTP